MNPVAMTIINPRKEYWLNRGSIQRRPVLMSATLPTELWGSAVVELTRTDGCKHRYAVRDRNKRAMMTLDGSPESFSPQKKTLYKLGRGPQGDAKNQISKLYAFQFQRGRILKMGFFVPMFQLVTPWMGPILTPGSSSKQTWKRSTRRCYITKIKALALTVWDKKIFKNFLLYLYVKSKNPQHRINFHTKAILGVVKKKMLIISIFSFFLNIFRRLFSHGR